MIKEYPTQGAPPNVAHLRGIRSAEIKAAPEALVTTRIRLIEVPLSLPDPFERIVPFASAFGNEGLCGTGTLLSLDRLHRVAETRGRLLVTLNANPALIRRRAKLGIVPMPAFASEGIRAINAGVRQIKLSSATGLGTAYLKALLDMFPKQVWAWAVGKPGKRNSPEWGAARYGHWYQQRAIQAGRRCHDLRPPRLRTGGCVVIDSRQGGRTRTCSALACLASIVGISAAEAATVSRRPFGTMPDGTAVEAFTLSGGTTQATIITLGASIQQVIVPARDGRRADVVLGCADAAGCAASPRYFGATIGRVASRIAGARFMLDGREVRLAANAGGNALHGGRRGFDKVVWTVAEVNPGPHMSVTLQYVSPDGDEGYPGTLITKAKFSIDDAGVLRVSYAATTDRPTIVALTNHMYWNLAGEGVELGGLGQRLTVPAGTYLPTDANGIPKGEFRAVQGTPFDFRRPHSVAARIRYASEEQLRFGSGYDHALVVTDRPTPDLHLMARLEDPVSGRTLEVLSNQPAIHLYTANFLTGAVVGKAGHLYRQGDAVALEPEAFPNTANCPAFGSIRLAPGERYENKIAYRFTTSR